MKGSGAPALDISTPTQSALRHDNGPTCGFVPLPRWARGPLSVPQDWGTPSCHVKARVVISNYALRSWAAGPLGSGSISPDQRHRTRFPLGTGPVSPRVLEKKVLRTKTAGAPRPPTGSRTPTYYPDPSAGRKQAPHPGGPEPPRVTQVAARARGRDASPGRLAHLPHSTR